MYCLDCGTEWEEGASSCKKCGLTLSEMQERLAAATEVLLYADAVSGDTEETQKLPPVQERVYRDKDGKELDPAQPIDAARLSGDPHPGKLPRIGADDPYVTVPMKKIVDEYGNVIASEDTTPKLYRQTAPEKRGAKAIKVIALIAVVAAVVAACVFGYRWFADIQAEQAQQRAAEQAALDQENQRTAEQEQSLAAYQLLGNAYADAGAYHSDLVGAYDTLMDTFARKLAVRTPNAQACKDLEARIKASKDDLAVRFEELGLPADSPYQTMWGAIDQLYDDLLARAQVLRECWDVSLSLSDVTGHTSEVMAPLSADGGVGVSDSLSRFQQSYEQAAPELVEPSDS